MGTAKSDDEAEEREPHPLAQNRPGVYVQVVGTPRKRKAERARREAEAASAPPEPGLSLGRESPDEDTMRPSGVEPNARPQAASAPEQLGAADSFQPGLRRDEHSDFGARAEPRASDLGSRADARASDFGTREPRASTGASHSAPTVEVTGVPGASSENTNHRADLMKVPGPPRMPSISLSGDPLPAKEAGASLLDAPRSLRPDSLPSAKQTSWALLAFVATLSAIITAAAVVAVREKSAPDVPEAPVAAPAQHRSPGSTGPQQVGQRAPSTEPAPAAAPVQHAGEPAPAAAAAAAPAQPQVAPAAAQQQAASGAERAPVVRAAEVAPASPPAPANAVPAQPLPRKPAPALAPRRPAVVPASPGIGAEAVPAPTPAQIIAEHARTLAPVELPAATDTSLPANPYEPPAEQ